MSYKLRFQEVKLPPLLDIALRLIDAEESSTPLLVSGKGSSHHSWLSPTSSSAFIRNRRIIIINHKSLLFNVIDLIDLIWSFSSLYYKTAATRLLYKSFFILLSN